jgi:hypothetical protein
MERRRWTGAHLRSLDIPYTRIDGIGGRRLP